MSETTESGSGATSHPPPSQAPPPHSEGEAAINKALLLNHEYDGIREYDNPMPKWWKWIFWGSFYFSIGYFFHYHLSGNGESVAEGYDTELAAAREQEAMAVMGSEVTEASLAKLQSDANMMADAAKLFAQRCGPCHGPDGSGTIGPNLTDDSWIHGEPTLMNIYQIIHDGVQSKGMPPWSRQLRPIEMGKSAAFVGSIVHTNRPGKAAEGHPIGADAPAPVATASATATPGAAPAEPAPAQTAPPTTTPPQ
jgi:cytochrome c oxidase cbb3-type subunit 3